MKTVKERLKKVEIEKAAFTYYQVHEDAHCKALGIDKYNIKHRIIQAWQQGAKSSKAKELHTKDMYAEEEVLELLNQLYMFVDCDVDATMIKPWFEQRKKHISNCSPEIADYGDMRQDNLWK